MKKNLIHWIIAALALFVLGGCASLSETTTHGDASRFAKPNMRIDKILMPAGVDGTVKELYMLQAEFVDSAGKPLAFRDKQGNLQTVFRTIETADSLPFAREFILSVSPGAAVAFINGRTSRSVADKGCTENCGGGPTIYNQANSAAVTETKMEAVLTTNPLSCSGTPTGCGRSGR